MSIWFFITILLFFGVLLCTDIFDRKRYENLGHLSRFVIIALFVFTMFHGCARPFAFNDIEVEYESRKIESLNLNNTTHGEAHFGFTIGYAYVDEEPYYYFYEERAGGLSLNSIPSTHSILIEDDSVEPHLEMPRYRKFKNPNQLAKLFRTQKRLDALANGIDFYEDQRGTNGTIRWKDVHVSDTTMVRIYVPRGTIKKQFISDPGLL